MSSWWTRCCRRPSSCWQCRQSLNFSLMMLMMMSKFSICHVVVAHFSSWCCRCWCCLPPLLVIQAPTADSGGGARLLENNVKVDDVLLLDVEHLVGNVNEHNVDDELFVDLVADELFLSSKYLLLMAMCWSACSWWTLVETLIPDELIAKTLLLKALTRKLLFNELDVVDELLLDESCSDELEEHSCVGPLLTMLVLCIWSLLTWWTCWRRWFCYWGWTSSRCSCWCRCILDVIASCCCHPPRWNDEWPAKRQDVERGLREVDDDETAKVFNDCWTTLLCTHSQPCWWWCQQDCCACGFLDVVLEDSCCSSCPSWWSWCRSQCQCWIHIFWSNLLFHIFWSNLFL